MLILRYLAAENFRPLKLCGNGGKSKAEAEAEGRGQRIEGTGQGQGAGFFRTMDAEREPAREEAAVDDSFSLTNRSEA